MEPTPSFGYWLRRRRKALDLTQAELAQRVSCSPGLIQKIEADARRPSRQIAQRLADALSVAPADREAFLQAARAERSAQLIAPALPSTFPALNTPDARRTQVAPQPTLLIGRAGEVATICARLRQSHVRLLTLTGPGGIGKTRLGLQIAAELIDDFAHGVSFVDLAPIRDPTLVVSAIAQTLGVQEMAAESLLTCLSQHLREKQMLLLLDNFEQVLGAALAVAALLNAAPLVKVLVTSRAPLRLHGEHQIAVPPLALPDPSQLPPLDELAHVAAVALFVQRVQAVRSEFELTAANAPAVVAICTQLDGLPLAIELAAAHGNVLAPQALVKRLSRSLTLLTGGAQDLPARHQTLRAAIAGSYDMLSAVEQRLFRRLGVFVGGCTLEAAEGVCDLEGDLAIDMLDGVTALLEQSLLRREDASDGEPRFRMLETIREYALERLAAHGEEAALHQRHAVWFLALAERADPELRGVQQKRWLERLEAEHNNLRGALAWSRTAPDDGELGLRLSGALGWFWFIQGNASEARGWLEGALEYSAGATLAPRPTLSARGRVLHWAGAFAQFQDDYARATTLIEASLPLYREAGNDALLAEALVDLGRTAHYQGDFDRAVRYEEQGLRLFREQGDTYGIAFSLLSLGGVALLQSDITVAAARYQEALALFRELAANDDIAWSLSGLGHVAYAQGGYRQAEALFKESLMLFRELNNRAGIADSTLNLGRVCRATGERVQAARYVAESLALTAGVLGRQSLLADGLRELAGVCAQERSEHATRLFGAAEAQRESANVPVLQVYRAVYERDVAVARAQLGEAAFAEAWAVGRALSWEQAVAAALTDNRIVSI